MFIYPHEYCQITYRIRVEHLDGCGRVLPRPGRSVLDLLLCFGWLAGSTRPYLLSPQAPTSAFPAVV